jgi:hypothetical protein
MRSAGLPAFQVALLPTLTPLQVQRSNHDEVLAREVALEHGKSELNRLLAVVEPRGVREHRIHFVGDAPDVLTNCWAWNEEMGGPSTALWKPRAFQFFVADPRSGLFAPSKFCAFMPARCGGGPLPPPHMTLQVYASLGEQDPRFDGNRARRHLADRLGFREVQESHGLGPLASRWDEWVRRLGKRLSLRRPLRWLLPPG